MNEKQLTTREAFGELISQRGWWVGLEVDGRPLNRFTASGLKKRFLEPGNQKGELTIETMEKYLAAAGYKVVQEKKWINTKD